MRTVDKIKLELDETRIVSDITTYKPNGADALHVRFVTEEGKTFALLNLDDVAAHLGFVGGPALLSHFKTHGTHTLFAIFVYGIENKNYITTKAVNLLLPLTRVELDSKALQKCIDDVILIDAEAFALDGMIKTPPELIDVTSNDYRIFGFNLAPFGTLHVYRIEGALYFNYADLVLMLDRNDTHNLMFKVTMGDAFYVPQADANAVNIFGLARIIDAAPSLSSDDRQQFKKLISGLVIPATAVL